jgi:hypothetical protein
LPVRVKIVPSKFGPVRMVVCFSFDLENILLIVLVDWASTPLPTFEAAAWRVSWSLSGNVLAVSTGDNKVSLWKEKLAGGWENVKNVDEST